MRPHSVREEPYLAGRTEAVEIFIFRCQVSANPRSRSLNSETPYREELLVDLEKIFPYIPCLEEQNGNTSF